MPRSNRLIISLIILIVACPSLIFGQFYFGKNKVQYTKFNWQVMETEHFLVYFYDEEEEVAKIGAKIAEESYTELAAKFNHEINKLTPLIIYSSPNYFSQTNVIPSLLPESVAGFTEFMKGRVVVPFHGSYFDFAHVLKHELVHVFTISKLQTIMNKARFSRIAQPPLWFIEGLAECWSTEWDSEADMITKDMVLSGRLFSISRLWEIRGSFFMYKLGQSICMFIEENYGSEKLTMLFENWWKGKTFNEIVKLTLGLSLDELSKKWEYDLKKKYFPEIADRGLAKSETKQLTKKGYSLKGVPVMLERDGQSEEWIIYKANKLGYTGIYMIPESGEAKKVKTLVKGERSARFESLYLLQSGIDANNKGKILFSSRSKENDVLYLYDLNDGKVVNRYKLNDISAIRSPRFSPSGNEAVFSAADFGGISDIYLLDLITGDLSKLTDDIYYDIDPAFHPDGSSILFSSDRCYNGDDGVLNLYSINLKSKKPIQITSGDWRDITPEPTAEGIYFASDRDGAFNIYKTNNDNSVVKISSLLTGAYDPRITPDKKQITFTGYQDFGFQIYRQDISDTVLMAAAEPPAGGVLNWRPGKLTRQHYKSKVKYQTDYSFDIAQSAISYDPVYGSLGGLQVAMSDMLGDHAIYFLLANTADTKDEFLTSFNAAVTYINRKNRLNWGLGVYHFYGEYYNDFDFYFDERQAGGLLYLNYPLSKFNRLESSNYLRYSNKDVWFKLYRRRAALLTNYVSFISDNSIWDVSGPIEGHRYNFTLGLTTRLDQGRHYNRIGFVDLRHYYRLGRYSAVASRLFLYSSTGEEPQRIYFGGSWSFRGFDRRQWYLRNIVFSSNELRFPLINNLHIGFPFGTIGFNAIRGALFADVGYLSDEKFRLLDSKFFEELQGSFGAGFRLALGRMVVFRFDFTRTTDFKKISPNTNFEFFFGWNF